jgi:hypothetical protein
LLATRTPSVPVEKGAFLISISASDKKAVIREIV